MIRFKLNSLLTYFLITQLLFVVAAVFFPVLINASQDLSWALIIHQGAMMCFGVGYLLRTFIHYKKYQIDFSRLGEIQYSFAKSFFNVSYFFAVTGVVITALQIATATSIQQYLIQLAVGDTGFGIRDAYLRSHEAGGMSGAVKMFGTATLSVYLYSVAIPNFVNVAAHQTKKFKKLTTAALILLLIKTVFSLDRLTMLAIILANLFLAIKNRKLFTVRNLIFLAVVLAMANFLTRSRYSDLSLLDSVSYYFIIGLNNFSLMIDSLEGHTYGFATILHPIIFVLRFLGVQFEGPKSQFFWEDNQAQYLTAYAYQDFGYYLFVFFIILGWLCSWIDYKTLYEKSLYHVSVYFVVLNCVCLFVVVPPFRGIEFWLSLLLPFLLITGSSRAVSRTQISSAAA